jgi:hypothetical protein
MLIRNLKRKNSIMKKLLLFLPLLTILMFSSCDSDPCKDVNCGNGTCIEGTCDCDEGWGGENCDIDLCADCENGDCTTGDCNCFEGYEGDNCETEIREKFIGNWIGVLDCSQICIFAPDLCNLDINIDISKDNSDITMVVLSAPEVEIDLFGSAELGDDTNTLDLEERQIDIMGFAAVVNGTIEFSSETEIILNLQINVAGFDVDCPLTLTKQ